MTWVYNQLESISRGNHQRNNINGELSFLFGDYENDVVVFGGQFLVNNERILEFQQLQLAHCALEWPSSKIIDRGVAASLIIYIYCFVVS